MSPFTENARYLSLGTWRRNGLLVPTPVWFAPSGAALYAFSAGNSGKVKRLRNSSRACVAHCDWRGTLLGEWHPAQAFLVSDAHERDVAFRAIRRKYGWQMLVVDLGARMAGTMASRAVIRIEAAAP